MEEGEFSEAREDLAALGRMQVRPPISVKNIFLTSTVFLLFVVFVRFEEVSLFFFIPECSNI